MTRNYVALFDYILTYWTLSLTSLVGVLAKYMDLNDLNKVWEVKPLKKVREDESREILEKVAKQVQPIMRKRKWKVRVLSEFW